MKDYSESTIPKFYELLESRGIKAKKVSEDTGIPYSNFTEWRKGRSTPKATTLAKLAEYLRVSSDFLAGSESVSESLLDIEIQAEYKKLSEEKKKHLLKYMRLLNEEKEK